MASRQLRKGEQTHAAILEMALTMASREGLEGLTIGSLADRMKMSKSGVFAHFGSREDLQIAVVRLYDEQFAQEIFYPAMKEPRGLPRLRALFSGWVTRVTREVTSGCIYISGAVEYDDRPGVIREHLAAMVRTWQDSLRRCVQQAIDEGHLRADTDPDQIVFEMYGLMLALHHDARFIQRPGSVQHVQTGFERLIDSCRNPAALPQTAAAPAKTSKKTA